MPAGSKKSSGPTAPPSPGQSPADDLLTPQVKAKLDDSELADDLPKALQKVDLDLDDAPFLEEEKEEAAPPPTSAAAEVESAPSGAPPIWKQRRFQLGAAAVVLLVAGAVAFFTLRQSAPPPPPPPPPQEAVEETPPPPPPEPEPKQPEKTLTLAMEPFLIEQTDAKGQTRFLSVKFTAVTASANLEQEFKKNSVVLRDAVYYYLKNKKLEFLTDKNNGEALKHDVLSVLNQYLGEEQLDNLLIEEYLVK